MNDFFQRICDFLNTNDRFAAVNSMRITLIREGYAEASFSASAEHRNGLGVVQGGALYTLADFAFAGAINSYGEQAIGMSSNISYLRPGTGSSFRAIAEVVSRGKRTGVFTVKVLDEQGRTLCHATMTGFFLGKPVFPESACESFSASNPEKK